MSTIQFSKNDKIFNVQKIRFDGELMEIIWPSHEEGPLTVGECITYYCDGLYVDCRVIRLHQDQVSLFIPNYHETLNFINSNRHYPRFSVNFKGLLTDISQVHTVNIIDLNQNGFGFIAKEPLPLFNRYDVILQHHLLNIHCEIMINTQSFDKTRYGSEITYIQSDALNKLQNYLLSLRLMSFPK